MKVTLTPSEMYHGALVGVTRNIEAIQQGLRNTFLPHTRGPWEIHVEGAMAELAVAKAMDLYWPARVNTFKELPDIDPFIEVRSGRVGGKKLIVRQNDPPDRAYVLIVGAAPNYEILGWMVGEQAMLKKYEDNPNNRKVAYFVPADDLCPIEELASIIRLGKSLTVEPSLVVSKSKTPKK